MVKIKTKIGCRQKFTQWLRKNDLSRWEFYFLVICAGYIVAQLIRALF